MSLAILSEQLIRAGITTEAYVTTANGKSELPVLPGAKINVDGVPVIYFKRMTKDHSHFSPSLLKQLWRKAPGYSIIHIHAWWNLVSLFSCCIALMRNIPVLVSPRGTLSPYSFQNKNLGFKWLIHNLLGKFLLNKCHIHVTSEREYQAIKKLVSARSITLIPNLVKLPVRKFPGAISFAPYLKLLFLSRIEEKKGLDILIAALALVTVPYRLTVAGDGNDDYIETLQQLSVSNGTNTYIDWLGFQKDNKFELLFEHDLFVLPSYDENFGNAVIESLSVGTAALVSEQVGLSGYVADNKLGWVCQTTASSVSESINSIAADRAEIQRIKKDAPLVICRDFSNDNLINRYIDMYTQLIAK
jgi:glycosyltransferase involved in cell wall biosynthesis